jgi:hypothetical protein
MPYDHSLPAVLTVTDALTDAAPSSHSQALAASDQGFEQGPPKEPVLSRFSGLAEPAWAAASLFYAGLRRTDGDLYRALGRCLLLYQSGLLDPQGYLTFCAEHRVQAAMQAQDRIATVTIKLVFGLSMDERVRKNHQIDDGSLSFWTFGLLAMHAAKLTDPDKAAEWLQKRGLAKVVAQYRNSLDPSAEASGGTRDVAQKATKQPAMAKTERESKRIRKWVQQGVRLTASPLLKDIKPGAARLVYIESDGDGSGCARVVEMSHKDVQAFILRRLP